MSSVPSVWEVVVWVRPEGHRTGDGGGVGVGTDADQQGGGVLRRPALAATVFAHEPGSVEIDRHPGPEAVTGGEGGGRPRGAIAAAKAQGHDTARHTRRRHFIVEELEQRLVGVHQREVPPAVTVVVEHAESTAVGGIVESGQRRRIDERGATEVGEESEA